MPSPYALLRVADLFHYNLKLKNEYQLQYGYYQFLDTLDVCEFDKRPYMCILTGMGEINSFCVPFLKGYSPSIFPGNGFYVKWSVVERGIGTQKWYGTLVDNYLIGSINTYQSNTWGITYASVGNTIEAWVEIASGAWYKFEYTSVIRWY